MGHISRVEQILLGALGNETAEGRAAYLDEECRGDPDLRHQVERLLEVHPAAQRFLGTSAQSATAPVSADAATAAGTIVGVRYKLLEPIGEGGMGRVWMAQQTEPVRRTVAVKLIKAGMDTKAVLARFNAERQALALMDHPNIAKVLDAGETDEGRPFFVMELVKGVPITSYCDAHRLPLRERLDLFVQVCQAVQHAHQKGVVHRDLKPSNVLVARYDDRPVPKVIDFGVAKAAGQPLTDLTLVTGFGAVVGTPEYMSPEQAEFNQLDIDTRSDIYALGVLLYELLTGTTPVTRRELERAGLLEVLRMIREQEPPRPSTRLSGSATLSAIAAARSIEPRALAGLVRNDLDWVVMKALEKDRNRRYETASGFAADVRRYLDGEAVQAHPPGAGYRFRKSFRKHRAAIAAASAFVGLLIAAVAISALLAMRARRAEAVAKNKRIEAEASANEAKQYAGALAKTSEQYSRLAVEAEVQSVGLKVDLDLAELRADPRIGFLRLARPLRHTFGPLPLFGVNSEGSFHGDFSRHPAFVELRQFATMAVLAIGQDYAPLRRPPTFIDGGCEVWPWRTSPSGRRLLTLGPGRSVKLWEASTGRPIATLRQGDERAITADFSPDGATVFTHSWDGVVRFWEAEDGRFRSKTEQRPHRLRLMGPATEDCLDEYDRGRWLNQLSNDRLITLSMTEKTENDASSARVSEGPDELWDSRTGRLVARLDGRGIRQSTFDFLGAGRWVMAFGPRKSVLLFSSLDGRPVERVGRDGNPVAGDAYRGMSSTGRTMATVAVRAGGASVHTWDVGSLRETSVTGPIDLEGRDELGVRLIADDLFTADGSRSDAPDEARVFRCGNATPVGRVPADGLIRYEADRMLYDAGRVVDARTWKPLQPPKGRKYHPDLAKFAPDGRFVILRNRSDGGYSCAIVDTLTEKSFLSYADWTYDPRTGWTGVNHTPNGAPLYRLPPTDRLTIPPDLLELWAKVVVRGELNDEGAFVKWDEPTWEKRRDELAARPAPIAAFPFPGYVAEDPLHWLRQEYEKADATAKPGLARELLRRAEAIGDKVEAARWRAVSAPSSEPERPPAPK